MNKFLITGGLERNGHVYIKNPDSKATDFTEYVHLYNEWLNSLIEIKEDQPK